MDDRFLMNHSHKTHTKEGNFRGSILDGDLCMLWFFSPLKCVCKTYLKSIVSSKHFIMFCGPNPELSPLIFGVLPNILHIAITALSDPPCFYESFDLEKKRKKKNVLSFDSIWWLEWTLLRSQIVSTKLFVESWKLHF